MPLAALDNLQHVVWAALEEADLETLRKLPVAKIDWNKTHPVDPGMTPLMMAIYRLVKKKNKKYVDIIEWLVRNGADPTRTLPDVLSSKVRAKEVQISLAGHSAFSLITVWMKTAYQRKHASFPRDLLSEAKHRMTIASVECMSNQRHEVSVDKSVVDLWERVLDSTSSHDVTFQAADKPVTAHSLVLVEASPVLRAMLQSPMREGGTREIEVRDTNSSAIVLFLETLYTCSSRLEPMAVPDVLAAIDLAHRWQVSGVVGILAEVLQEGRTRGFRGRERALKLTGDPVKPPRSCRNQGGCP